jgi:hypothetical protein
MAIETSMRKDTTNFMEKEWARISESIEKLESDAKTGKMATLAWSLTQEALLMEIRRVSDRPAGYSEPMRRR